MHIPRVIVSKEQFLDRVLYENFSNSSKSSPTKELLVELNRVQSHHLVKVLRRQHSNRVELLVRQDLEILSAEIVKIDKTVDVKIIERLEKVEPNPKVHLILAQSSPKVIEQCVQQGTETGISSFHIFLAQHTGKKSKLKADRLEVICESACEQARLGHIPQISYYDSLDDCLSGLNPCSLKLLCVSPNEESTKNRQVPKITCFFENYSKITSQANTVLEKDKECVEIYIAVGPEGGFSISEIELLQSGDFSLVSLGPYVARVETAVTLASGISRIAAGIKP